MSEKKVYVLGLLVGRPVEQRLVQVGAIVTGSRLEADPERDPDLVVGVLNGGVLRDAGGDNRPSSLGDVSAVGRRASVEPVTEVPGILSDSRSAEGKSQGSSSVDRAHGDR